MRYVYLGDKMTDPTLLGRSCEPVARADGRGIVESGKAGTLRLVRFDDGRLVVVLGRRLRLSEGVR
jgi:hypothetical protein